MMYRIIKSRLQQGRRTVSFPAPESTLPDRFRGLPILAPGKCGAGCAECVAGCPTDAILLETNATGQVDSLQLDLGNCLFCGECERLCPEEAIRFSKDYRLSVRRQEDLILGPEGLKPGDALETKIRKMLGRALKLRQVSAGGCNGCEVEVNALGNPIFDMGRFGIQMVASPRHADGLLITGPVTENMREALLKTYQAIPAPKIVIAVGACARGGGPFRDHDEVHNGVASVLSVDLFVPGCPPHPLTIMDGLLRLLGRVKLN